MTSVHVMYAF